MANITYLLGAGASAGCLPVVGIINERISSFQIALANDIFEISSDVNAALRILNGGINYNDEN